MTKSQVNFIRAIGMGAVAGMRSMTAPAVMSCYAERYQDPPLNDSVLEPLATSNAPKILGLAAAGEMVVDKLPFTPPRTMLPSVIFRALSGAVVGWACTETEDGYESLGMAAGALAAVAATYGMYHLRKDAGEATGLPDVALGMMEDVIAVCTGIAVMRLAR